VAWTTDDLIAAVRVRAQVPDEGEDSEPTDAEILRIAHEEMLSRFVGIIRSARENYLVTSEDIALVEGTQSYRVPRRAHANAIRDAWIVAPSGRMRALRQLDLTDGHYFGGETGEPAGYYLSGAKLVLEPTPSAAMDGYSLRVFFYRAPSRLVLTSECGVVESVADQSVVVDDLPSGFGFGSVLDVVQARPPFDVIVDGEMWGDYAITLERAPALGNKVIAAGSGWTPAVGDMVAQGDVREVVTSITSATEFASAPEVGGARLRAGAAAAFEPEYTIDITFAAGTAINITAGSGWSPAVGDIVVQGVAPPVFAEVSFVTSATIFTVTPGFVLAVGAASAIGGELHFGESVDMTDIAIGDFVCEEMTTCVPQIPDALWPALVSAVAVQVRLHEADPMGASSEAIQRDEYIKTALASMQPRVDGRAKSIVNLGSALRRRRPF
jgi:hypothetical protein